MSPIIPYHIPVLCYIHSLCALHQRMSSCERVEYDCIVYHLAFIFFPLVVMKGWLSGKSFPSFGATLCSFVDFRDFILAHRILTYACTHVRLFIMSHNLHDGKLSHLHCRYFSRLIQQGVSRCKHNSLCHLEYFRYRQ